MTAARRAEQWDRRAADYDRRMSNLERRFLSDGHRWVAERARGRALELAIGTGVNLASLASLAETAPAADRSGPSDAGAVASVVGLDLSGGMLAQARNRSRRLPSSFTTEVAVNLVRGDAMVLPFPDATFDTVLSTYSMCGVPDVAATLAEALRVLRPGGRLLLADHVISTSWPIRMAQRAVDLITVPTQGEHFCRRPLVELESMGVTIVETERHHRGLVEFIHARR